MKAQFTILTLLLSVLTVNGFATTNEPEQDPQQEKVKKENATNYNYNLFRFYSVESTKQNADSTKVENDPTLFKEEE